MPRGIKGSGKGGVLTVDLNEQVGQFVQATETQKRDLVARLGIAFKQKAQEAEGIAASLRKLGAAPESLKTASAIPAQVMPARAGRKPGRRTGDNKSQMVLSLVQELVPKAAGKKGAKTKKEIMAVVKERKLPLSTGEVSTALQALRVRSKPQRIGMVPGPEGKTRGGGYYPMIWN